MQWLWQLIVAILLGALIGWLAGKLMKSDGSFLRNLILGILGAALGGWLGGLIGIGGGWVMSIILAIAGACLIIFLWRLIFKKK
jgi:uncharacterized membrane protein YeaQ/YmgE (transglycosylase-associated protein family)